MLQAANTDLFNPFVPKAQNSQCENLFSITNYVNKSQLAL